VPAREWCSSKVPAYGAVRCQRTEPGGGWTKDRERASHNRLRGHSRGFGTTAKPSGTVMLLTEAFPIRGTSPAEPKPTSTESLDTISPTVNEARSFPTVQNAKRGAKKVRGKGENRTS